MSYEVFSTFTRCAAIHGTHSNMNDATACYKKLLADNDGKMPSWKDTGKHIHVVGAVDPQGMQRAFNKKEKAQAKLLELPPEALLMKKEHITTFSHVAKLYLAASNSTPISGISLDGFFDYEARDKHFWNTDAGMGQALAYAQQVIFTIELSLKALLESSGQLVAISPEKWQIHDLVGLFNMLDSSDQKALKQQWFSLPSSSRRSYETLCDLLRAANHYNDWRYIPTLTSTSLTLDVTSLLSASDLILRSADRTFRENSPVKIKVDVQTNSDQEALEPACRPQRVMVMGRVSSVNVPEGFDPFSQVEVVLKPTTYISGQLKNLQITGNVTALFRKSQVEDYFELEGEDVCLGGWSTDSEPHILQSAQHRESRNRSPTYSLERRTLRGKVYNLTSSERVPGHSAQMTLVLDDLTYYTKVDCLFLSDEEHKQIVDVRLGDETTISGHITTSNGRPVTLVGPEILR